MTKRIFRSVALLVLCAGVVTVVGANSVQMASPDVVIDASSKGGNGASNGSPDAFRVVLDGQNLKVYLDGTLSRSLPFTSVERLTVNGSSDDDTLTVDFSGGNPIPSHGLVYNGRENVTATGDTLIMTGGSVAVSGYNFLNRTDGSIEIDSRTLTYTGLEPVIDLVPGTTLTVNGTNANNAITYRQGLDPTHGLVAVDNFETIEFANKTTLVITALDGNDDIVINNSSVPTGLTGITVNGGNGNDVFSVYGESPVSVTMNGDAGDDLFRVSPTALANLTVNGGVHVLGDKLLVDATSGRARDTGSTVDVTGFVSIAYAGIEAVDLVNDGKQKELLKNRPVF